MGRGKQLTSSEKEKITFLREEGYSMRSIAKKINRSYCSVNNYCNNRLKTVRKVRYCKISNRDKNRIIIEATKNKLSAKDIQAKLSLPISVRRIQQILSSQSHIKYKKMLKKPPLTKKHKIDRLNFAKKYMSWTSEWSKVIFSDEKKFNLDGPDGCSYFWQDLSKKPEIRMSRNFGGGSVMIWAAFSIHGKSKICLITSKMNAEKYIEMLDVNLIEYLEDVIGDREFIFMQDNAAIHNSRKTKEYLTSVACS